MTDDWKARDYESNPRDNFASFDNREIPGEKPNRLKGVLRFFRIRKGLIVVLFGLAGFALLLGYLLPEKYPYLQVHSIKSFIENSLSRINGETNRRNETVAPLVEKEKTVQKPVHHQYSKDDVEQAKRELLNKRRVEFSQQQLLEKKAYKEPPVVRNENETPPPRYEYEIVLFSGGRIFTDNVVMTEETVSFQDSGGLWVSINRNEVVKLTRTRVAVNNP